MTRRCRVRIPLRHFANIHVPPDLTDPKQNDIIADPDAPGPEPPEFSAAAQDGPPPEYQDPEKNDFIPRVA